VASSAGAALAYDPLGRLFQVTSGTGAITRFLYDGDALVAEYDGAGAMLRRHVHWAGADVPVLSYEGATLAAPRHLFADHQGSIVALADGPGYIVAINAYDEYGIPAASNTGRFQYTGQAFLPELGMYYYRARMYSPTLGRFLQTDPIGYRGGLNLYGYVGDDPVNHTDPSGTVQCDRADPRCSDVHKAAAEARTTSLDASARLRGLAAAVHGGGTLSAGEQSLLAAYEGKFGTGSGTESNLNAAARHFDRVADKIGVEGSGMRVNFDASMRAPASAPLNGDRLNIGPAFFNPDLRGATQWYVVFHEGGHSAGLDDLVLPPGAAGGRPGLYGQTAYGVTATDWLGAHNPGMAARNNENYTCFVVPACGGP
jgi:RHS repeat-associated protein